MLQYLRVLVPTILLIAGCTGNESTNNQNESGTSVANAPATTTQEFDILEQDGWIRHTCLVYQSPNTSTKPVGYLPPPSSVGVADDGSGWLQLIHGPIKDEATNEFLDDPKFQDGLYIEKSNFTTELPYKWYR